MSIIDSLFGNKAAKTAGKDARFVASDISLPGFGSIDVNLLGKRGRDGIDVGFSLDPTVQALQALGIDLSSSALSGLNQGPFGPGGTFGVGSQLDPLLASLFSMSGADPGIFSTARGLSDLTANRAAGFGGLSTPFTSTRIRDPRLTTTAGLDLYQRGGDLLTSDFRDIAARETALLRQLARPAEENLVAQSLDKLFSRGQTGITGGTTASNRLLEGVAGQLEQADLNRVLAGLSRADTLRQQDRALGQGLLGLGIGGIQTGEGLGLQSDQLRLGQDTANADRILSTFGLNLQGLDQATKNALAALATEGGLSSNLIESGVAQGRLGLDTARTASDLATSELGRLLSQLTAGQGVQSQSLQNMLALLTGSTALSGQRSSANAGAGQLLAQGSGIGGFWDFLGNLGGAAIGNLNTGPFGTKEG